MASIWRIPPPIFAERGVTDELRVAALFSYTHFSRLLLSIVNIRRIMLTYGGVRVFYDNAHTFVLSKHSVQNTIRRIQEKGVLNKKMTEQSLRV